MFEKQLKEISEYTKGLKLVKSSIGWGALFLGEPYSRPYKGKLGVGYEVHYDAFKSKDGNFFHHVDYYVK